jgi:hypothetical protein
MLSLLLLINAVTIALDDDVASTAKTTLRAAASQPPRGYWVFHHE